MADQIYKQQQLQRLIERSLENFKILGKQNLTAAKVRSRIQGLKENWGQFLNGHAALLEAVPERSRSTTSYFQENVVEMVSEAYQITLDHMSEYLEELEPPVSPNQSMANIQNRAETFSLQHMPLIQLPPFDGSYDQWESFRDRFTALIRNNMEINNFARMHFLASCLKGQALECIANLPVTADNFDIAWQMLTKRYENQRRLLNVHLSKLLNLTCLTRESANELRSLFDTVNIAVASLKSLDRAPEELWSDILVHLIVQKLDSVTRKAWNVRVSDGEIPPFDDLSKFIESRTRALEEYSITSGGKLIERCFHSTSTCRHSVSKFGVKVSVV